jgi:hypothetical protein
MVKSLALTVSLASSYESCFWGVISVTWMM